MPQNNSLDDAMKAEVIAAEQLRCKAIADDDFVVVEELIGNELSYLHSTGRHEDKAEFMASLRTARRSFVREPLDVRIYGDVAVVLGGYIVSVEPRDGSSAARSIEANGLQVWVKRGGGWQLVAHQGAAKVNVP
jgi:hypothetical protein